MTNWHSTQLAFIERLLQGGVWDVTLGSLLGWGDEGTVWLRIPIQGTGLQRKAALGGDGAFRGGLPPLSARLHWCRMPSLLPHGLLPDLLPLQSIFQGQPA